MFVIERIVSKGDYEYAVVHGHPHATKNGYVLHHRVLMENFLGRLLKAGEVIHHKDRNKKHNELSNLELMTNAEHRRVHGSTGRSTEELICAFCGKSFMRFSNRVHKGNKNHFCSRKCNGAYQRAQQLNQNNTTAA